MDVKEQSHYSRTKYIEFNSDEDGSFEEVAKVSDGKESGRVVTRSRCSTRKPDYKDNSEEESSDESMTSEEHTSQDSEDSTWSGIESKTSPKRSRRSPKRYVKKPKKDPLSEYEKIIEKNKAERIQFLKSLKIDEAKKDLLQVVDKVKKTIKVKKYVVNIKDLPPVKRPSRSGSKMINYSEGTLYKKALQKVFEPKVMHSEMSFKQAFVSYYMYDSYEYYLQDIEIQETKLESQVFIYDKSALEKLSLNKATIIPFKRQGSYITVLAWYPCPEKFILAAGGSIGTLSFSNVHAESNSYVFQNHLKGITHLKFNPFNHNQIVSSSLDGSVRTGDMVRTVFNELYVVPEDTSCQDFDFLLESSYLVAQGDGKVAIVDIRTNRKKSEKQHSCHDSPVRSLSVHPLNKNFFVTANFKGCVRLWDLRMLQKEAVANIKEDHENVLSAYFSPITGSYILVSSHDSFSLYDSKSLSSDIWLRKSIKHKHNRNVKCETNWLPNSEEAFYISSNKEPRGIVIYNTTFNVFHTIYHNDLQALCHSNVFHPFRPALAVKRHRKVYIFS